MHKKGETGEIIATIVIFSLLMSLGIYGVTKLISKRFADETDCAQISITAENAHANSTGMDICYRGSTSLELKFTINNTGLKKIEGLEVNLVGKRDREKTVLKNAIEPGAAEIVEVSYDRYRNGDLRDIFIVPIYSRIEALCHESMLIVSNIKKC